MVLTGGAATIFNKVKKQTTRDDHVNIQMYYICAVSKHTKKVQQQTITFSLICIFIAVSAWRLN